MSNAYDPSRLDPKEPLALGYQHDFDEELGCYWYGDPPPKFTNAPKATELTAPVNAHTRQGKPRLVAKRRSKTADVTAPVKAQSDQDNLHPAGTSPSGGFRRPRDEACWNEAGDLLFEYVELQAGAAHSEELVDGFIGCLRRSPAEFRRYVEGDDMAAGLVDWYLRIVR
jgi:hypothetical protein